MKTDELHISEAPAETNAFSTSEWDEAGIDADDFWEAIDWLERVELQLWLLLIADPQQTVLPPYTKSNLTKIHRELKEFLDEYIEVGTAGEPMETEIEERSST